MSDCLVETRIHHAPVGPGEQLSTRPVTFGTARERLTPEEPRVGEPFHVRRFASSSELTRLVRI